MNEKRVCVLVKYHPCSLYAMGKRCPFFKKGSKRCLIPHDQCKMPEYDRWFKEVVSGKIRYFHCSKYIHIFNIPNVPLIVYHSVKHRIVGEALVKKVTKENNTYYYWFDNFILYPNFVDLRDVKTDRTLRLLGSRGRWVVKYLNEETLQEIRRLAGLSEAVIRDLNEKLQEVKKGIRTLPLITRSYEVLPSSESIMKKFGLAGKIDDEILDKAKQILSEARKKGLARGRSMKNIMFASILAAIRSSGATVTVKEFSEKFNLNKRKISKLYRLLISEIELTMPKLTVEDYLIKCSEELHPSQQTIKKALSLANHLKKSILPKPNPRIIAAVSFYVATRQCRESITQYQIAKAFGVSTTTIRNYTKLLKERN